MKTFEEVRKLYREKLIEALEETPDLIIEEWYYTEELVDDICFEVINDQVEWRYSPKQFEEMIRNSSEICDSVIDDFREGYNDGDIYKDIILDECLSEIGEMINEGLVRNVGSKGCGILTLLRPPSVAGEIDNNTLVRILKETNHDSMKIQNAMDDLEIPGPEQRLIWEMFRKCE